MEGCVETSRPGLDGQAVPRSLDDVRAGRARFVTLASDSSNYGKYFNIGTVTYMSAEDHQKHTVQNVVGYVHDTGGAFKGRPDKIDVNTTICRNCSDAQASALAAGNNVSLVPSSQGLVDNTPGGQNSGYGNVLTGSNAPGAGTSPSASSAGAANPNPLDTKGTGVQKPGVEQKPVVPTPDTGVTPDVKKLTLACEGGLVTWECGDGATRVRGQSQPFDTRFQTEGKIAGNMSVIPRKKTTYTIQCYSKNKLLDTASCVVLPIPPKKREPKPVLSITTDEDTVRRGDHVSVTWSATKVKMCHISGDGISEDGVSGTVDTDSLMTRGTVHITMTCDAVSGVRVYASTSVDVQ
jgi:hypothetical protein